MNSVLASMINHSLKSLKIESLEDSELKKTKLVGKPDLIYIDSYIATRRRNYYNILLTRQDVGNQKYMTIYFIVMKHAMAQQIILPMRTVKVTILKQTNQF